MDSNYINSMYTLLMQRKNSAIEARNKTTNNFIASYYDGVIDGYNEGIKFLELSRADQAEPEDYEYLNGKCEAFDWIRAVIIGKKENKE